MIKTLKKSLIAAFVFLHLFGLSFMLNVDTSHAQNGTGANTKPALLQDQLTKFGNKAYNQKSAPQDIRVVIGGYISNAFTLLGTLFVAYLIYGGFRYMTSRGESSGVDEALKTIQRAIIGLAICLLAWAITSFVTYALVGGLRTNNSSRISNPHQNSGPLVNPNP